MNRCGTCRHWTTDKEAFYQGYKPISDRSGICRKIQQGDVFDEPEPVHAQDASGYYAAVICRDDFGCVLHEEI